MARGWLFGHRIPPPVSLVANKDIQQPVFDLRTLQQCFSNTFMSDSLLFRGFFLLVFLDFFKVQRCFVDCKAKFYSSAVFFVER